MSDDMAQNQKEVFFYFDFISHNAYLAWVKLRRLQSKYEFILRPVPVLFAGFLKANNQRGPAEIAPKSRWMIRDVVRKAQVEKIPLSPPASHPFNPLPALRLVCGELDPTDQAKLIEAIFQAAWVDSQDISDPAVLLELAEAQGQHDLKMSNDKALAAAKTQLRANTEIAIESGVFGVPAMRFGQNGYWGFDDIPHLVADLQGDDPLSGYDWSPWLRVKPSAQRKEAG